MNICKFLTAASVGLLISAEAGYAAPPVGVTVGPPASVTMGPPASVTMGPPAAALAHIPPNVFLKQPPAVPGSASANVASELGKLNAAHASMVAMNHAAPNSTVGVIAAYKSQLTAALALTDPVAQAAAITTARQQLALSTNKDLTSSAVTRIDAMLGISGASPELGTTQ